MLTIKLHNVIKAAGQRIYTMHAVGISMKLCDIHIVYVSRCGGAERAGTTIYDVSLRGELGWVLYI